MNFRKLQNAVSVAGQLGNNRVYGSFERSSYTPRPWEALITNPFQNEGANFCIRIYTGAIFGWYEDGGINTTPFDNGGNNCFYANSFLETCTTLETGDVIGLLIYCGSDETFLNSVCILNPTILDYCANEQAAPDGAVQSQFSIRKAFHIVKGYPSLRPNDTTFLYFPIAFFNYSSLGFLSLTKGDIYVGGSGSGGGSVVACMPQLPWDLCVINCETTNEGIQIKAYMPSWYHEGNFVVENVGGDGWKSYPVCATGCCGFIFARYEVESGSICEPIFCSEIDPIELTGNVIIYEPIGRYSREVKEVIACETTGLRRCVFSFCVEQMKHGVPHTYNTAVIPSPICFNPGEDLEPGVVFPGWYIYCARQQSFEFCLLCKVPIACYHAKNPDILYRQNCGCGDSEFIAHSNSHGWIFEFCGGDNLYEVKDINFAECLVFSEGGGEASQGSLDVVNASTEVLVKVNSTITKSTEPVFYTEVIDANEVTPYEEVNRSIME